MDNPTKTDVKAGCAEMLQMDLYVIITTPTNGTGRVMENLPKHLEQQVWMEQAGHMFGAGPLWSTKDLNPYKQAYERRVKLIGTTSHYVTADLDEGPIVGQDTIRVTHAQPSEDYVSLGRDVESQVLARAIQCPHTSPCIPERQQNGRFFCQPG